ADTGDAQDVLYSWYFDDGTASTDPSSNPRVTHRFTQPGIYYVTVTATREGNAPQSQTIAQMVHRPLTRLAPPASGNVVYEQRGAGRVWVVNQDNDSVSVLNASNNARIAEIAVGAGPRALAIAPDGSIWVTNKFGGTISVVDPQDLAVRKT